MSKTKFTFEDIVYLDDAIDVFKNATRTKASGTAPTLRFPTHFARDPLVQDRSPFDPAALLDVIRMLTPRQPGVPLDSDLADLAPNLEEHHTVAHLEGYFRKLREIYGQGRVKKNMHSNPNIVDREDWYTDDVFGQQQFTGTNPTTISAAGKWFKTFKDAAGHNDALKKFLDDNKDHLFVQDYSYFRTAVGLAADAELTSGDTPPDPLQRYLCAPVALFHQRQDLSTATYKLFPVAIIIDWIDGKGALDKSVSIFNPSLTNQKAESWPWRYAKTCVSTADWLRHQVEIHLVGNHFVEEAIMVGVTRTLPLTHPIRRLLEAHWIGTRPVNVGARGILVPGVVAPIVGLDVPRLFTFLNRSFSNYNFKDRYVPTDLKKRGFPATEGDLETKFSNYGYARNALPMWGILQRFVSPVLESYYNANPSSSSLDKKVADDKDLQRFCLEIANNIKLGGFPSKIETFEDLVNMITMCVFIPTVGHSAINYLQEYYLVFVPNRPAALYTPLPKTLEALEAYTEQDLFDALPVRATTHWLIAAQLTYLLSFRPPDDFTLFAYAERESKGHIENPLWPDAGQPSTVIDGVLQQAAIQLKESLEAFGVESRRISLQVGNTAPRYGVLDPELATSSIIL